MYVTGLIQVTGKNIYWKQQFLEYNNAIEFKFWQRSIFCEWDSTTFCLKMKATACAILFHIDFFAYF